VTPDRVPGLFSRLLAALPDAATAAVYGWAWFFPFQFGAATIKTLMLIMLIEFLVVHSGGFIGMMVLSEGVSRKAKTLGILGFGSFYMLFAVGFSLAFDAWWPALTFLYLLAAKFAMVWLVPLPRAEESERMTTLWGMSVAFYLAAVFAGVLLPLPRFGLDVETVSLLALPGEGLWIEKPHTLIVSGLLYFAACAWSKWAYRPGWGKHVAQ